MKRLQNKIRKILLELREMRSDLSFQSLPKKQKENFYEALKMMNDFEDFIIINYIINHENTKTR